MREDDCILIPQSFYVLFLLSILCENVHMAVDCTVISNEFIFTTDFINVPDLVECIFAATQEVITNVCKLYICIESQLF